jgi:Putative Flp pilus-assembly TadE/G-like
VTRVKTIVADERGVTAILIAMSMIVLLGMAAIAVDSGLKFDERRQEQAGVDAGVLSAGLGAQVNPVQPGCGSFANLVVRARCNGTVVAMGIINKNADTPYPIAAFDNPTLCPNSAFPSGFAGAQVQDGATMRTLECLRWNANLSGFRAVLPVTSVSTTFGRVLGILSMPVNAVAQVGATVKAPGLLIPFAVGPTGGAANMGCLYEPPAGQVFPPCSGPEDGNFGYMRPYRYGDELMGYPPPLTSRCNFHAENIAAVFAMGADHIYALNSDVPATANDRDNCPNKNQWIDEIDVQTGGSAGGVSEGGIFSIFGVEGRLLCKDGDSTEPSWITPAWDSGGNCQAVNNRLPETVDDNPLWNFIDPGAASESGGACNSSIATKADMEACLVGWRAFAGPHLISLFTEDLATKPRFAWVPRVHTDPGTGGSGFYTIEEFLPVYIQTLYLKCTASSCAVVFEPGEPSTGTCVATDLPCGFPSNGNDTLDAMSAFILRSDMLPFSMEMHPGSPGQMLYNLSE